MQNDQGCYGIPKRQSPPRSEISLSAGNGFGSGDTQVCRWTNVDKNVGAAVVYIDNPVKGGQFVIKEDGVYLASHTNFNNAGSSQAAVMVNTTQGSTGITSLTYAGGLRAYSIGTTSDSTRATGAFFCKAGDIVVAQTGGNSSSATFSITKISN